VLTHHTQVVLQARQEVVNTGTVVVDLVTASLTALGNDYRYYGQLMDNGPAAGLTDAEVVNLMLQGGVALGVTVLGLNILGKALGIMTHPTTGQN